jgi:hypothetical protein
LIFSGLAGLSVTGNSGGFGGLLKISALASRAGLSAQTLHSKIRRGGGFTPEESAAIHNALAGVRLSVAK